MHNPFEFTTWIETAHLSMLTHGSAGSAERWWIDYEHERKLEEREAHEATLSGIYGEAEKLRAERDGLGPIEGVCRKCSRSRADHSPNSRNDHQWASHTFDGDDRLRSISEVTVEHAGHWLVLDLCTGETYPRPFEADRRLKKCDKCTAVRERIAAVDLQKGA